MDTIRWSRFSGTVLKCEIFEGAHGRRHKMWLLDSRSGLERFVEFVTDSVVAREGHVLSAFAITDPSGAEIIGRVHNASTGQDIEVVSADAIAEQLLPISLRNRRLFGDLLLRLALGIFFAVLLMGLFDGAWDSGWLLGSALLAALFGGYMMRAPARRKRAISAALTASAPSGISDAVSA